MSELRQRQPRVHNEAHLRYIRSLNCLVCGDNTATQAAHLRFSDASAGKFNAGIAAKADDCWTVPLCGECHDNQHRMGDEAMFWKIMGIDPLLIARQLYAASGDHEEGCRIVEKAGQPVNILAAG